MAAPASRSRVTAPTAAARVVVQDAPEVEEAEGVPAVTREGSLEKVRWRTPPRRGPLRPDSATPS